jgi:hypothetical protein
LLGDGGTKPIENVTVGDYVLSRDEHTASTAARRVTGTWIHEVPGTLLLHLAHGEQIETTKEHRFAVPGKGFVRAGQLRPGWFLDMRSGPGVEVVHIEPKLQPAVVYNFSVHEFHTYFVTKTGVWVHNTKDFKSTDDPSDAGAEDE